MPKITIRLDSVDVQRILADYVAKQGYKLTSYGYTGGAKTDGIEMSVEAIPRGQMD